MDTIFALATAPGKSGVAIIRISGPEVRNVAALFCNTLPASHTAKLCLLRDKDQNVLDQALVLFFQAPNSFTGEDVLEFQIHGSTAIINAVQKALSDQPGLRLAEPGEFTRRAFENNRLSLDQIEGLADLIQAETEAQRLQAYRVFAGALGDKAAIWRSKTIRAAALIEATIDFADEDVPTNVDAEVLQLIDEVSEQLSLEHAGSFASERIREGFEVAIVGAPNAGKSTLLNALAGRDAAITSEFAGTTRDVIEVQMDLQGIPVTLLDTAGLRDTTDAIEEIGVERAIQRAKSADLRIFLETPDDTLALLAPLADDLIVQGKADLSPKPGLAVSGITGYGISELLEALTGLLKQRAAGSSSAIRLRHRNAIASALAGLDMAKNQVLAESYQAEMVAEELRLTIRALSSLIGHVDVEDVLGEIFASFCLGK